jgi:hypothetical protein
MMLAFVLFGVLFSNKSPFEFDNRTIQIASESNVSVELWSGYSWQTIGSGTLIQKNGRKFMLTAFHVASIATEHPKQACLMLYPEECLPLDSFIINSSSSIDGDWTLYRLEKDLLTHSTFARIDMREPVIGEQVTLAGFPNAQPWLSTGTVGLPVTWNPNTEKYVWGVNGFVYPGSSGGGVFDSDGDLIGLVVAAPVFPEPLSRRPAFIEDIVLVVPVVNVEAL